MTGFGGLAIADGSEGADVRWAGVSKILGPSWLQLPTLTVGLLGVQVLWSVEMSYASPYLISLGLSKSLTAVAFLAGPLSGLIVQPLIGVIADNSKSRFGRRRPYMMLATVLCAASMLLLGFTRDFVSIFTPRESSINDTLTIVFAVIALYGIDFSVNAVQAVDRALIVDTVPFSLQPDGNAWAARMLGIGSVIGFFIGNLNLHEILSIFGNSQLEVLSVLAAFLLLSTQSTTAACVKEKVIISSSRARKNLSQEIREIWDNILTLPRVIRQICIIQFLAWLAWFPVLFYTTVYIGDLYKSALPVPADDAAATVQDDQATIVGARAFFFFGLMALTANFVLPLFVKGEDDARVASPTFKKVSFMDRLKVVHLCELWAASHLLFALCMGATFFVSNVHGATFLISLVGFSWAMTQWAPFSLVSLLFAAALSYSSPAAFASPSVKLAEEILASSSQEDQSFDDSGSISIRLLDARTGRASELLSEDEFDERQRLMDDERRGRIAASRNSGEDAANSLAGSRTSSFESARHNVHSRASSVSNGLLGNAAARQSRLELFPDAMNADTRVRFGVDPESLPRVRPSGLQARSGIIIGIHNLFIVIPQFISTALASLVFALFDPAKSVRHGHNPGIGLPGNGTVPVGITMNGENSTSLLLFPREGEEETEMTGVNSVAILFRIGGVSALLAFVLCWRLARELRRGR